MDKKKKIIIGIVAAVVIITIILAIITVMVLSNSNNPKNSVAGLFKSLKSGDINKASEYVTDYSKLSTTDLFENSSEGEEKEKLLYSSLEYKIKGVTENGDTATVEVEATNKNFKIVVTNYMKKVVKEAISGNSTSKEDLTKYFVEELQDESIEKQTTTQTLNVKKVDGKWKVEVDDNLENALFPGLEEGISLINEGFNS